MATILDTAQYIIEKEKRISVMKLQKLCYYAQAWSLAWDNEPLFEEDFEAWANGPVCRKLYTAADGRLELLRFDHLGDSGKLSSEQKSVISRVLTAYGDKELYWLSENVREEQPWRKTHYGTVEDDTYSRIISKALIRKYYSGLEQQEQELPDSLSL